MPSSGATTTDLTTVLVSPTGQTVAGQTVTFSKGADPTAFFTNISNGGVTDANGTVTAKLNLGTSKANRTVTITAASAGAISATNSVDVTGTTITVSGSSSLAFGATTTLTFSLKDSAGAAVPGTALSVTSATGNTVVRTPATGITNSLGQITANITANAVPAADDTITATGGGVIKTQALTISSANFTFTTPAAATEIPLSTTIPPFPTPLSVNWTNAGAPVVGSLVSFASTRGTIVGSPALTNALGTAGVSISAASAGPAIITASGPGGIPSANLNVMFVATTASSVTVQANPSVVQFTTGSPSQSNNSSTISVVVRDGNNNLVKNAGMNFTLTDISGGSLNAARAITDVNGSAAITYTAGATSSAQNGVLISATVTDISGNPVAAVTNTTTLTVSGQSLLVRLGTDNLVGGTASTNTKTYLAIVTDSGGNPIVGTTVRFVLRPSPMDPTFPAYFKGSFAWNGSVWAQTRTVGCLNEDKNFNGILDVGEDFNGNGRLDPGAVASVTASATTDVNGLATAIITYPKSFSYWVTVTLEARTGVVGNDPPARAEFVLPGPSSDYTNLNVAPLGQTSPFGVSAACNNTL